ncbi:MAG: acetyl-CoA carboxylase carboxyltransferase subunit beta [Spirochaetes bacterium]|nr:acetyl-CoA carboxylase carboxyltransferase subunit beta [Spirochaetota bacterium]
MKETRHVDRWVRAPKLHAVVRKRDERAFLEQRHSCPSCQRRLEGDELESSLFVCPHCGHHIRLTAWERIRFTADEGVFQELSAGISTVNPLGFPEYEEKLAAARSRSGLDEAVVTGLCRVGGVEVVLAVMDFQFIGGSMGSVVGEKVMRAMLVGAEKGLPVIVFTASGGARMQEGILSLMQMAKTSVASQALERRRIPFFVVLTDPTTAGVLASFAMLGDVIVAEPGALMRFAGQRVVAGTIREKVPDNFPLAAFHLERGFVDALVHRRDMRKTLGFLLATHARGQGGRP